MNAHVDSTLATPNFELMCNDGPAHTWEVISAQVDEAVNEHYIALVTLEIRAEPDELSAADFLGASATLVFIREVEVRRVHGVVTAVEVMGWEHGLAHLRLRMQPALSLIEFGRHSRIFQDCSVRDIVDSVLGEELGSYAREVELADLRRGSTVRDYCVQYRESDARFTTRLLEEEGVSYVFEHPDDADAELLVLRDDNSTYPDLESLDGGSEVPVVLVRPEQAASESIYELRQGRALTLTEVLVRDYDWTQPSALMTHSAGGLDEHNRSRRRYVHGQRRFIFDDQVERGDDVVEGEGVSSQVLRGQSNVTAFRPGLRFRLSHPRDPSVDGEYLLTRVRHSVKGADGGTRIQAYANEFECVPADLPLRPRPARPRPRVYGPQTATVVGDEEIQTDEFGRIKVQFHWEEEADHDAEASCWVRCAQSWAGPGWGAQFIPRRGMEVVVEFLEGNPDRPLVTGCVYNGDNALPFALPGDKTQSGWRSASSPGGEGYNMLRFEDSAGNEEIHIHGQKDWTIVIENDKHEEILHDQSLAVTHDRTKQIGHDETSTVVNDRSVTVGNNHDETIAMSQSITVGVNRMETVGVNSTETVGGAKTLTVGAAYSVNVGAALVVGVSGGATESVQGGKSVTVDGGSSEAVTEGKTVTAKQADEDIETNKKVNVGELLRLFAGKKLALESDAETLLRASDKLVIKCGKASITMKKNGSIKIEGGELQMKGKGNIKIKGKKVGIN